MEVHGLITIPSLCAESESAAWPGSCAMATQAVLAACRAKRLPSLLATSVHGFLPENLQELGHASLQLHKLPDTGRCSRHCDKKPCLALLAGSINNTKGNGPVLLQLCHHARSMIFLSFCGPFGLHKRKIKSCCSCWLAYSIVQAGGLNRWGPDPPLHTQVHPRL